MAVKIQNMLIENQHSRFYTIRDTSTRRGQRLRQQHTNKDLSRYSLVPRSTREWNALSDSMTSAATLEDSKAGLTKLLTALIVHVTAHHWAVHTTKCILLKPAVYMFGFLFVYICSLEQSITLEGVQLYNGRTSVLHFCSVIGGCFLLLTFIVCFHFFLHCA